MEDQYYDELDYLDQEEYERERSPLEEARDDIQRETIEAINSGRY